MLDPTKPYRVIKSVGNRFELDTPLGNVSCHSRKKVKRTGDVLVGDAVYVETAENDVVIKSVEKRKNSLIRPAVANIDQIAVLISPYPEPDYFLIDKLILNCHARRIDCILCVNKTDICDLTAEITRQYAASVKAVVGVSALKGDASALLPFLSGKTTCFAGQSAVGKSSLINLLVGKNQCEVGDLSDKILRGKNTTTAASLIKLSDETFVVDTPGFSMLDVFDVKADDVDLYYDEYVALSGKCKYHRCTHITEPDCEVKRHVEAGLLPRERYERYKIISANMKAGKKY